MSEAGFDKRARARELADQFAAGGDALGWFDELYKEAAGDNEKIPWADLEPNRFFKAWAEKSGLRGDGRRALVIGCGLGDDAVYLDDLGFEVTAFDISPTAIEWARRLHADRDIKFEVMDLFQPPASWTAAKNPVATAPGSDKSPPATAGGTDVDSAATAGGTDSGGGFDFVLEVYTIQPLPIEMRERVIDSIAAFVAPGGELVVVARGREDDDEAAEGPPWPLTRADFRRFVDAGFEQIEQVEYEDEDEPEVKRFVAWYRRDRSN